MLSRSNSIGVWCYRRTSGAAVGGAAKALVLTVPGRRSGEPRSTCVAYLETTDGLLVWGTASGAPRDPDWFRNLRAASVADVQIGARRVAVVPRELLGAERDAAWATILARRPGVARYARKAGRVIPVALLTPGGTISA
jgi:deazaflavin-dependent oxidoreductase (nitroreductase family)